MSESPTVVFPRGQDREWIRQLVAKATEPLGEIFECALQDLLPDEQRESIQQALDKGAAIVAVYRSRNLDLQFLLQTGEEPAVPVLDIQHDGSALLHPFTEISRTGDRRRRRTDRRARKSRRRRAKRGTS